MTCLFSVTPRRGRINLFLSSRAEKNRITHSIIQLKIIDDRDDFTTVDILHRFRQTTLLLFAS